MQPLRPEFIADLQASGLTPETIEALRIKEAPLDFLAQFQKDATAGYYIPYYDLEGKPILEFWRVKLVPAVKYPDRDVKYLQKPGSGNHIYLPGNANRADWMNPKIPLFFTEGEKKAAASVQKGHLTGGLSGIWNWRTRSFRLTNAQMEKAEKSEVVFRLDTDGQIQMVEDRVAPELTQIPLEDREIFLVGDSDAAEKPDVQRALFEFSVWLQSEGAHPLQILLPHKPNPGKQGLDDFFLVNPAEAIWNLPIVSTRHPRIRQWLRKSLDLGQKQTRSDELKCSFGILNELDSRGQRYIDPRTGSYYFLDGRTDILHALRLETTDIRQLRLSSFGTLLAQEYGVGTTDSKVINRLADVFASRKGLKKVVPRRVTSCTDDALYFQISDSFLLKTTATSIEVVSNGTDGQLFLSDQVEPLSLDTDLLLNAPEHPKWFDVIRTLNLVPMEGMSMEETHLFLAALFYLSPWFRRWRGLMLPLELFLAEAGSGKTFLLNLRRSILTGKASLENSPMTQKDWYAQVVNAPAIWICDNMGDLPREIRDPLSDELARLITDPEPKVSMRQLYKTTELGTYPIDATFCVTAIRNPFHKGDIMQRAAIVRMLTIPKGKRDSSWYTRQLSGDGRARWVADQAHVAQRFLQVVGKEWDESYLSSHRLVHFEQCLLHMGTALGQRELMVEVVKKVFIAIQDQIMSGDPVMEALKTFADEFNGNRMKFQAKDMVQFFQNDRDSRFEHIHMLDNQIKLGRYLSQHPYQIKSALGIEQYERQNQKFYRMRAIEEVEAEEASTPEENPPC